MRQHKVYVLLELAIEVIIYPFSAGPSPKKFLSFAFRSPAGRIKARTAQPALEQREPHESNTLTRSH